jgi:aminotransferase EvaB
MKLLINDLGARVASYRSHILNAVNQVIDSGWFVLGPNVKNFEDNFSSYIGVSHCITLANGTDAIELALKAFGITAGDSVATVANAGMYTTGAMLAIGATPYFMDVDTDSRNVTLSEVEKALDAGVKVVVVTHLYGQAVSEIREIAARCSERQVLLLEDCAQAHGAIVGGKRVGSFGDAASFSFYPTKNLGALGDGGAVVTGNADIAHKLMYLRQYGWSCKYQVEIEGARNSRLDEIQASILSMFLPELDAANAKRRNIAEKYSKGISHTHINLPSVGRDDYVAHLYVIRSRERDSLRTYLGALGITTDVHYPIPDHRQPVFGNRYASISLPNTEQLVGEVLTLPCYPEMSDVQVEHIIRLVNAWKL